MSSCLCSCRFLPFITTNQHHCMSWMKLMLLLTLEMCLLQQTTSRSVDFRKKNMIWKFPIQTSSGVLCSVFSASSHGYFQICTLQFLRHFKIWQYKFKMNLSINFVNKDSYLHQHVLMIVGALGFYLFSQNGRFRNYNCSQCSLKCLDRNF